MPFLSDSAASLVNLYASLPSADIALRQKIMAFRQQVLW